MSDIQVTSELTLDYSQFSAGLAQGKQDLSQFAQDAGNTKISPQVSIDFSQVQTQWQAAVAQLNAAPMAISVSLDMTNAQQQLQIWLGQIQNVPLTLNVPNASQIGADIGNAAGAAIAAAVAGMAFGGGVGEGGSIFGTWNPGSQSFQSLAFDPQSGQFISPDTGMGIEGVGWPGAGGGSGPGNPAAQTSRFARMFAGQYLMRRAVGAMKRVTDAGADEMSAINPYEHFSAAQKQYQADVSLVEAVPIYGPMGAAAAEVYDMVTGVSAQSRILEKSARMGDERAAEYTSLHRGADAASAAAGISGLSGLNRSLAQSEETERLQKQTIGDRAKEAAQHRADRRQVEIATLESQKHSWIEFGWGNNDRLESEDKAVDAKIANLQNLTNDDPETQKQIDIERAAAAAERRNRDRIANLSEDEKDRMGAIRVSGIGAQAQAAQFRISGQTRQAGDLEFSSRLDQPIRELASQREGAIARNEPREVERINQEIKAKQTERDAALAERKQTEDLSEGYQAASSAGRVKDIQFQAANEQTRATGNTRGAGDAAFAYGLEKAIRDLTEQIKATVDGPKKGQLQAQLSALEQAKGERIGARTAEEHRADEQEISDIQAKAEEDRLKTEGRNYEASLAAADHYYKEKIRLAEEGGKPEVASALRNEQNASRGLAEHQHGARIADINEQAHESELRQSGQSLAAKRAQAQYDLDKQIMQNAGDPKMQDAIYRRAQDQWKEQSILHPANQRDAYNQLLAHANDDNSPLNRLRRWQGDGSGPDGAGDPYGGSGVSGPGGPGTGGGPLGSGAVGGAGSIAYPRSIPKGDIRDVKILNGGYGDDFWNNPDYDTPGNPFNAGGANSGPLPDMSGLPSGASKAPNDTHVFSQPAEKLTTASDKFSAVVDKLDDVADKFQNFVVADF